MDHLFTASVLMERARCVIDDLCADYFDNIDPDMVKLKHEWHRLTVWIEILSDCLRRIDEALEAAQS